MPEYRKIIYENYFSNQVNKGAADDRVLLEQQAYYYRLELVPFLPKNKSASIIDIGCGFGSFIKAARNSGYTHVQGIDLSPEQVQVAKEMGIDGVRCLSAENLFKRDEKYDCIVGIDIIEHFSKDELVGFLAQIKELLNEGGMVLFRTPNMDAPMASVYAHADFSHEVFLNKSSALQLMKSLSYHNISVSSSMIHNRNKSKEVIRKLGWDICVLGMKLLLFFSGRTWENVVFSPNLIITAYTKNKA